MFKSNAEKELWIKLNAERQIEWERGLTYFDVNTKCYKPTLQALCPRTMNEALEISKRQCELDEIKGKLRYSFEDLLTLSREELLTKDRLRHNEFIEKFNNS